MSEYVTACMNCSKPLSDDNPRLFCDERCRSEAEFVRYWRRVARDGRIEREDVQYAIQIQLAHWVAGGYDRAERRIPLDVRERVKARDRGRCVKCGGVGVEIDHVDGPSVALKNLQLLCVQCHREKTAESLEPATREEQARIVALEVTRVWPDEPTRLADDDVEWSVRQPALRAARRRALGFRGMSNRPEAQRPVA